MTWEYKTLDQLGEVSRGRSKHRPRNDPSLFGGDYPFIQTADVKNANFYITEYDTTYNEKGLAQSKLWHPGTLCITIAANIADTGILAIDACFPDSVMGFLPYEGVADVRFVKYCFDILQQNCKKISQGAAQDNLSWEKLSTILFPAPPIEVQKKIADMLSIYDDLIENNQKQIKLLEEAAQRLYKEWFVDLRFPSHETTPITDGIPEGWIASTVGSICNLKKDAVLASKISADTPYIGLEHMPRVDFCLSNWGTAEDATSNKFRYAENDIIFGKIRPYFHKVGFTLNSGVVSTDSFVMVAKQGLWGLLLMTVFDKAFVEYTYQTCKEGAKMPRADWNQMEKYPVLIPDEGVRQRFEDTIWTITRRIKALALQNHALAEARDRLLPKLMNGEIEV
ncbi:MAG: restriction endonuclease subunit S [Oscillospiraceae bacterium]|nr:restriction endonuclease subunit S [Oscillospiraceae bacterium]